MAVVQMQKMKFVTLSSEKDKILDILKKTKSVELKEVEDIESTHTRYNEKRGQVVQEKLSQLHFAIEMIKKIQEERLRYAKQGLVNYELPKKPFLQNKIEVDFDSFLTSNKDEVEIFSKISELNKLQDRLTEIKAKIVKNRNMISGLNGYKSIEMPLSIIKDTKSVSVFLGTIPSSTEQKFQQIKEEKESAIYLEKIERSGEYFTVFAICHKDNMEECQSALQEVGYTKCSYNIDLTPKLQINKLQDELKTFEDEIMDINEKAIKFERYHDKLKLLYDYYTFKFEKIQAQGSFRRTDGEKVVVFESWTPKERVEHIKKVVEEITSYTHIEVEDAKKGDNPPTLVKNNKVVSAFEVVTDMYSSPAYGESDPNFSVMIFFFIFFGFMMSDAGYGLILAIGGFLALKLLKLDTGMKKLVTVVALGGVSTIIWGIIFGGWFSIDVSGTFLGDLTWFTPLDNPMGALGIAIGLGMLQILWGLFLKGLEHIKNKRIFDAIFDVLPWYTFFAGVFAFALSMVPGFEYLSSISSYIIIAGMIFLVLTQGRKEKGLFKKGFKGVASLYDIINYASDLLSYARLFGLGLATGVVGLVMNSIGGIFIDLIPIPALGYIAGGIFIIFGHTLNIALGVLGAYVHNCRLQYIEFFGKFYEGGGDLFTPLGSNSKYIKIK